MSDQKEYGSAYKAQAAFDKHIYRVGSQILLFEHLQEQFYEQEGYIKAVRILPASPVRAEYLLVVSAFCEGGDKVAFQRGDSFADCIVGFLNRLKAGSLKWKDDEYANKSK